MSTASGPVPPSLGPSTPPPAGGDLRQWAWARVGQRLPQCPPAVQAVLQQRLAQHTAPSPVANGVPPPKARLQPPTTRLAGLLQALAAAAPPTHATAQPTTQPSAPGAPPPAPHTALGGPPAAGAALWAASDEDDAPTLRSARGFGRVWSAVWAQQQLALAREQVCANAQAGPLHSHRVALRALELANRLSPDYLRHLLLQLDTLDWLDDHPPNPAAPGPAARRAKRGRSAGPAAS